MRAQLKFFEQLDQMEKQRKEEQEREILLKAAKVTVYKQGHRRNPTYCHNCIDKASVCDLGSVSLVYISSAADRR